MIRVENLIKRYKNGAVVTEILHGLSFEIKKGEYVSIMGPSGSGKTTLLNILGFLDKPTKGIYKFLEEDTAQFGDKELARLRNKKIGFIFQSFNLLPYLNILENVKLPLVYADINNAERNEKAIKILTALGLDHRLNYFPNQISGGEQQRVAIARALVNDPSIIFADEPTGNLDSKSAQNVMEILKKLHEEGKTIILITHDKQIAERAQRVIFIKDGKII